MIFNTISRYLWLAFIVVPTFGLTSGASLIEHYFSPATTNSTDQGGIRWQCLICPRNVVSNIIVKMGVCWTAGCRGSFHQLRRHISLHRNKSWAPEGSGFSSVRFNEASWHTDLLFLQAHDSSLCLKDIGSSYCHQQSCELRVPVWGTLRPTVDDILHGYNVLNVKPPHQSFWTPLLNHEASGRQAQLSLDKPPIKDRSQGS